MQITNVICPEEKYPIKCPYPMEPEFITVHNTANDASAMAEISYMIGNNEKCSFHVAVDDCRVVTGLPFNRNGWHAGDGGNGTGNRKSIGIEICYSLSGGDRFIEAEKLGAEYIAMLLRERNWGIDRVKKHQDWSGKYCPHRTLDMGWQRFLDMVQAYLDGVQPQPTPEPLKEDEYRNGSTIEVIYADTDLTNRIGNLDPWEVCYCYGIFNNRALVRYKVYNTDNKYKIGWARWLGGVVNRREVEIPNEYQNGSTPEEIFADTYLSRKIGSLSPYERCDCLDDYDSRPVVLYHVDGTNSNYKVGFAEWEDGIQ